MRTTKTLVLCSTSALIMAAVATPAWAQVAGPESAATAQETPSNTESVPPQQDDAVEGAEDTSEVEAVVVTGIRRSLQSAQGIRRNSDQIVDAIVAEDIGKLPDVTASDSLARLPGVQVERSQGEANRVLIRGLPDITTTYNGRDIFTAEARFVAIQDFPAGGVAALEVYKSSTANLIEPGIAGLVNVRARRPFDFTEREIAGSLRATYAYQSEEFNPNGNILISDRFQTGAGEFGALINFSYTQLDYRDSARFNGGGIRTATPGQVPAGTQSGFRYPDAVGLFYAAGERTRPSVNGSLQWRPTDNLELYADFLYQGFRREVSDRLFLVPIGANLTNVVLKPGTNQAQSLTSSNGGLPFMFHGATDEATDTYQVAIGGTYTAGPLRISADLATTDSQFDLSVYSFDSVITTPPTVDVNFDVPDEDGGVSFNFRTVDPTNPANFRYEGIFDRQLLAQGDDIQFRTDARYETGFELFPEIEAGFRFSDRNGAFENGQRFGPSGGIPITQAGVPIELVEAGFRGSDIQPLRRFISPTREGIRDNIGALRARAGFPNAEPPADPLSVFEANEKTYAGYGQLNFEFPGEDTIDGTLGLRVVKTEVEIAGTSRSISAGGVEVFTPRTEQSEFTDYLPSLNVRYRPTDDIQIRFAANKTRTRPAFNQLNPTLIVDPTPDGSGRRNARGGNIELQPLESDNYDLAFEYFFSPTGNITVTGFRRYVDGFIADQTVDVTDPVFGLLRVTRPENLSSERLDGIELQATAFLDYDFIPPWAQGFGVQMSATYLDSDLPGISDSSYNVIGIYEQGPVSARLAYNHRSTYRAVGAPAGEFVDEGHRLDLSTNYTPIENITLTFDISNILGEPYRNFNNYGSGTFPRDVRYEETIYSLGVRFRY
jgi:TonB-dependent receptor